MTELALVASEVGVNERTLRRAVNQGTLRAARLAPRSLRLPLSEQQYVRRSWPLLSTLRTALRTEQNVRFVLLFGSAARGTDSAASDIDLLVDMRDSDVGRVVDLSAKLTTITGRRVDVVRLEDASTDPFFLADVVGEGRVLVDRDELWPRLRQSESALRNRARRHEGRRAKAALEGIDRLLIT